MRNYKILCSDLDGTLLNSLSELSNENAAAIEMLAEKGVFFVPSTGRSFAELPEEIRSNPAIRYYICSNGASVLDKETGSSHLTGMRDFVCRAILEILRRYRTHITLRYDGRCYVDASFANTEAYDYYNVCQAHRVVVRDFAIGREDFSAFCEKADQAEVISVFFRDYGEMLAAKKEVEALGGLRVVSVSEYNLEIMNADAGKGNALLWLAKEIGIHREDTVSVGDSDNDSSIIVAAGLGLAVSNAWQSLKDIADDVICSNDEHAIQEILRKYF